MNDFFDSEFLGVYAILPANFANLVIRLLINLLVVGIIVYFFYFRKTQRKDYLMAFSFVSVTVFALVFLLDTIKLQVGFALGLFAIFGIIRYRTITIPVREMSYLFVIIGVSIINALANKKIGYGELMFTNLVFIGVCWFFESNLIKRHISVKTVVYDNIRLIKAGKENELKADLEERLGLSIVRVELGTVDFLKDSAVLNVSYIAKDVNINTAENNEMFDGDGSAENNYSSSIYFKP